MEPVKQYEQTRSKDEGEVALASNAFLAIVIAAQAIAGAIRYHADRTRTQAGFQSVGEWWAK